MEKIVFSIEEAAEIMHVSPEFVKELCTSPDWTVQGYRFPCVECGTGNYIIPVNALCKWLDDHAGESIRL